VFKHVLLEIQLEGTIYLIDIQFSFFQVFQKRKKENSAIKKKDSQFDLANCIFLLFSISVLLGTQASVP
jgi:hypothetical protein